MATKISEKISISKTILNEKAIKRDAQREPKESQNGSKIVPRSVMRAKAEHAKSAVGYCKNQSLLRCWASRWRAKGAEKRVRIEVKIKIDFEVDFAVKIKPKWSPKVSQMELKSEKNRFKIV